MTSAETIIEIPTKPFVDSLSENKGKRHDVSTVVNDLDTEHDTISLANIDKITVNIEPTTDNELSNKNYVHDTSGESTVLRFD